MNFKKIFVAALAVVLLAGCGKLSQVDAKFLAEKFINENLVGGGLTAEILNIESESGFFKLDIKLSDGREVKSLMSQDGKIFVPEAMYIDEIVAEKERQVTEAAVAQTQTLAEMVKSDKPVVELFVMSHCPFGTQAEKAIIPAIEKLGDSVDFRLEFVDYAMHGETEVREELQQFAISEKYPDKLIPYLKEFLAAGDSAKALAAVDLTSADLAGTIAAADAKFEVIKNLEDKSLWLSGQYPHFNTHAAEGAKYSVKGSPTLVVNGKIIEGAARTPAGMLEAICAAFEIAPETCSAELSTATPSSGFGYADGSASGTGECS
ncbi:hypothetical protein K9N08_04345 [Candidatus Gracilibacteria bacterium]|nr:hypothetical protein [Candidatus Gracilibacteria bacterium]MCF7856743.1 hypothetical protein [Candidatus Gracilibacteria bacterium]MCF7896951.1 hypothetical protein [Candidatus Gracilibacteria bacterium]